MITAAHIAYLEAHGITRETIDEFGVYTVAGLEYVPEAYQPFGTAPGIMFPWEGPRGGTISILRPDQPLNDADDTPVKYVSPKGAQPILWTARVRASDSEPAGGDQPETVLIVEGCKQTLAAASTGIDATVYGINGCWGWRERVDDDTSVPISDLVVVEGRHVVVALDIDAASNRQVYDAGMGLADACRAQGALSVRFLRLPAGKKTGLDDLLATVELKRRRGYLERLIKGAKPKPADVKPKPQVAANPSKYFQLDITGQSVFQAKTLADDAMGLGPVAKGTDGRFWAYDEGVWVPAPSIVVERSAWLMGERYRGSHARNSSDIVAATTAYRINSEPVPEFINFRNVLVDWRTGDWFSHAPEVPSTVQLEVDWNPAATCPEFEQFLSEVVPPDVIEVVWELIGYLLYSGNPLHTAVMLVGKGRNGKGTFLRVMKALIGARNCSAVSLHDLVNTRFSTATLFGKLANIAGDIDGTYLESTATLKAVTGEDQVSAEHKGRDRFDFTPWAVPIFSANKVPASADTTIGYLSRWLVIPFPNSFEGREDRSLGVRLTTQSELEGIAAKALGGLEQLLERGQFSQPESLVQAKREFKRRVDQVQAWVDDTEGVGPAMPWMPRSELFRAYQTWASRNGFRPVRATEFYDRLESVPDIIATRRGSGGIRGFVGIEYDELGTTAKVEQQVSYGISPPSSKKLPDVKSQVSDGFSDSTGRTGSSPLPHARTYRKKVGDSASSASSPPNPSLTRKNTTGRYPHYPSSRTDSSTFPTAVDRSGTTVAIPLDLAQQVLAKTDPLTVDVETSGYPVGHHAHELRTVQLGHAEIAFVLDPSDAKQAGLIRDVLARAPRLHAHSATADLVPLAHAGLCDESAWNQMHDTVIPAKLADPNSTGSDPGLKELAEAVLDGMAVSPAADEARKKLFRSKKWLTNVKPITDPKRSGWAQVDPADPVMLVYAASDVLDTAALASKLPVPEPVLAERERAVQRITARVTHRGLRIDGDYVTTLMERHRGARDQAAARVRELGVKNPRSDRQIAEVLVWEGAALPVTEKGNPSVAGDVLGKIKGMPGKVGELASAVLDYREHAKVLSTFLEPYWALVERGDGRVRPTVYTLQAATGRMSCVRPNLQQVPREGGIRACIVADPGYKLISADFSGVEVRIAAALSQDANLVQMIAQGVDLHTEVAKQVWGPDATKAHRYIAKRIVFGRLYGGGVPTLAKQAGQPEHVVARAVKSLDDMLPQLRQWSEQWRGAVKAGQRRFTAYSGRVIHLSSEYPHMVVNYLIQGTGRELLVDALLDWERTRWAGATVLPVHDEVLSMVPEHEAEQATQALVECMTTELRGVQIVAEPSEPSFAWKDAV